MKKILSWSLALLILVSSFLTVSAITVSDNASLLFPEGSVSVSGNKITLLRHRLLPRVCRVTRNI